jgi:small subunit ribosomal protein S5
MSADGLMPVWKTRVAMVRRTAKTVKGGRRFSFGALVVVGNTCGCVGLGWGKSGEVAGALQKAERAALAQRVEVPLTAGRLPHEVRGHYCGATVLLRPAPPGTGIIASRAVRNVLECAGVKDVVGKSLGARSPANVAKATLRALLSIQVKPARPKFPVLKLPVIDTGRDNRLGLN